MILLKNNGLNVLKDSRIMCLMHELGLEGLGFFFVICDIFRENNSIMPLTDFDTLAESFIKKDEKRKIFVDRLLSYHIITEDEVFMKFNKEFY